MVAVSVLVVSRECPSKSVVVDIEDDTRVVEIKLRLAKATGIPGEHQEVGRLPEIVRSSWPGSDRVNTLGATDSGVWRHTAVVH